MKLAIVAPGPPDASVVGGAERLWTTLRARLTERGHEVDLVVVPTPEDALDDLLASYQRFAELDVSGYDVVITGKYPAWMIHHPRHVVYLLHPLRGLYDTYPAELAAAAGTPEQARIDATSDPLELITWARRLLAADPSTRPFPGPFARAVVQRLDTLAFSDVAHFAAISHEVAARPGYLPDDRPVMVVHPESDQASRSLLRPLGPVPGRPDFLAVSRLDRPKRLDLVLAAFGAFDDRNARLTVAGDGPDRGRLLALAESATRVRFVGRVDDDELDRLCGRATAVVFTPDAEDYGYVTAEAMAAGTPVITADDSGGATELVEHGVNGLVLEADPRRLAWGMAHIADNPFIRWQMGLNARRRAAAVSFDPLLDLIESLDPAAVGARRPRALVLSTYPIEPMVGGGQRRLRNLTRVLAERADVTVLVSSASAPTVRRRTLEVGLVQVEVPRSAAQREAEEDIYALLGLPVDDITAADLAAATPAFGAELSARLADSDVVIASHPFLAPVLPADLAIPLIHDSHNHEAAFKAAMLPSTTAGRWLAERVRRAERVATERASAVLACTDDDLEQLRAVAPDRPGRVVANGVDTVALPFRTESQARQARTEILGLAGADADDPRPLALFIGSWHLPNIDAARIVLGVAARRPDWLFVLAGSHTSEFAGETIPDNVHLIAVFAESLLWPLLAGATVALNPMVSGGGSNLKLFDYLAVGTPVLTTEVGARGLDDPDAHVVVCEPTVAGVAAGLDRVAAGEAGLDPLGRVARGRALVEERYDWRHLGLAWADMVLSTARVPAPAPTPRTHTRTPTPIVLSTTAPPPIDPVEATMRIVGRMARTDAPTPKEATVDPLIQESLERASDNRFVGRVLPTTARLRFPKQALIRLGQVHSNEQLNYNEALLDAVNRLAATVETLRHETEELRTRVDELAADRRAAE